MLEVFSKNQTISSSNGIVSFTSQTLKKGCSVELTGTNTIQLKKCGVYEIIFEGEYLASTAGNIVIQMSKNGTLQPQAIRTVVGASTTESKSISISTIVQVKENDSYKCCDAPVTIQFMNLGVGVVGDSNLIITKIC